MKDNVSKDVNEQTKTVRKSTQQLTIGFALKNKEQMELYKWAKENINEPSVVIRILLQFAKSNLTNKDGKVTTCSIINALSKSCFTNN